MSDLFWILCIIWAIAFGFGWMLSWNFTNKPTLGDIIKGMFMLPAWIALLVSGILIALL